MVFTKRLRDGVRSGRITAASASGIALASPSASATPWQRRNRDRLHRTLGLPDITHSLAVASGFLGVLDLLKVAKHGSGQNIYLIRFHYIRPKSWTTSKVPIL